MTFPTTPVDIEANIRNAYYFTALQGASAPAGEYVPSTRKAAGFHQQQGQKAGRGKRTNGSLR